MIASPALMNACVILCLCALIIELVSFAVPGWLIVVFNGPFKKLRRNYAVWYVHECVSIMEMVTLFDRWREVCNTYSYGDILSLTRRQEFQGSNWDLAFSSSEVIKWEVEVTVGVICLILASPILVNLRRRNMMALLDSRLEEPSTAAFCVPAVLIFASVVLFTVPLIQMTKANIPSAQRVAKEVPYGCVLGAIGAFICFCISALFVGIFCKRRDRSEGDMANNRDCSNQDLPMLPS